MEKEKERDKDKEKEKEKEKRLYLYQPAWLEDVQLVSGASCPRRPHSP